MRVVVFILFTIVLSHPLSAEEDFSIAILWMGYSPMSEELTAGAMEMFSELTPDLRVEIRREIEDEKELSVLAETFSRDKDALIVLRSSGAGFLARNPQPIPAFIGAANNPVYLGVISNMDRPGGNISGVTYYIDFNRIFSFIRQILPDLESVLLLYEKDHPGSEADRYFTGKVCGELSIGYFEESCVAEEDAEETIIRYRDKVDAVILGNQALFNNMGGMLERVSGSVPLFALDSLLVPKGVLASLSADNLKLGRMLAGSVISVLYRGKKVGDIPVMTDRDPKISINIQTADKLGIVIPIHLLRVAEVYR